MTKLSMEDYASFFENPHLRSSFTVPQLNQIIFMHGFMKLHHSTKEHILGLIETLDLVSPIRSTIQQGGASTRGSRMLVDELQRDMETIGWGACRVGSVLSFERSPVSAAPPIPIDLPPHHRPNDVPPVAAKKRSGPERRGRPPKTKKPPDLSPLFLIPLDSIFIENGGSY
ncbi:hypothetical protein DsansV1_C06g0059611 [Dioscorea sansibarensis]